MPETLPASNRVPFHPLSLAQRYVDALRQPRFVAGLAKLGYNLAFAAALPWAVLPVMVYLGRRRAAGLWRREARQRASAG